MTPLVSVRGLRKEFVLRHRRAGTAGDSGTRRPVVRAVDGVSFDLARGETLGLVGESGCGKSTTGRCLLRLIDPTEGSVFFDGRDVLGASRGELRSFRRRAQIVFQDPAGALHPRMRVGQVIREVLDVHEIGGSTTADRSRTVSRLLERVGLGEEHVRRFPHELSGGQRQRLGIARALAVEPDFIVLDEPVSALDVSVQAQVVNLLIELQEELGLTYLFIAHDLSLVERVSDRIAVMYLGRIVEIGPASRVAAAPLHPYTQALLSAVPRLPAEGATEASGTRVVLRGDVPSPAHPPSGCAFHPRCPHPRRDLQCETELPVLREGFRGRSCACWKECP